MIRKICLFSVVGYFFSATFCPLAFGGKVKAFVSIIPQVYFVERVGGRFVDVEALVGPGRSPATYEPTPKQMARLAESQVYFRIGVPFEHGFIDKLTGVNPDLKMVDTREGVDMRFFDSSEGSKTPDPHIWLDPKLVRIQAGTICNALCDVLPEFSEEFRSNLRTFIQDLYQIDREIDEILVPVKGQSFYVFHPAFGYFGDSYGLKQVAVEIEGKEPSPRQLSRLLEQAEREGVRIIFVQPQFSRSEAEAVARGLDGAVVPIDPLAADYLHNLKSMAEILREGLMK
ncbi:MAG TPA: ABC transporter substrate-binding protein [Desulfobacteraceae bacterium]|nr:ABC transporter substrate-binding protein [Desulfobacteraceae bacterium]